MARELEFLRRVTHGWGEGKDHQRVVATIGDVFLVPGKLTDEKPGLPEDVANEMRAKGYAAFKAAVVPNEAAGGEVALSAAPTRPPGLAGLVR